MIHKQFYRLALLCVLGTLLTVAVVACSPNAPSTSVTDAEVINVSTQNEEGADPETTTASEDDESVARPEGWGEESHSNDADPNYEVVFPQDTVNKITITIAPEEYEAMQANMVELFGEQGNDERGPGGGRGGFGPQDGERPERPADGEMPEGRPEGERFEGERPGGGFGGGFGRGGGDMTPENPMWVSATIQFEDDVWTNVGVRYKGNSSLTSGWRSGTEKLPFKLDFDEFEDDYPEIDNQRFYGFKQLSLANGFSDASFLRDAVTYDILEEAGLPSTETAFYEVFLDHGEGPVSLGLYTMIEVIDDTSIDRYFGDDDGNIYEADGSAASLAEGTFEQIADSFQKENNEDEGDWSDIEELYNVLHAEQRTTDPDAWRASLEAIFDVDGFLEWLAISAVIQHWDTYGAMNHNFYLYNDPASEQLTWISWDHNMSMSTGGGPGGGSPRGGDFGAPNAADGAQASGDADAFANNEPGPGGRGGPGNRNVTLDKANVGENWPLIRYLLDEPTYYDAYINYVEETVAGPFDPDKMAETYQQMAELIEPYAAADVGQSAFEDAVQQLIDHAYERADAVEAFINEQS